MTTATLENAKSISIQYLPYAEEADPSRQMQAGKFLFPGFVRNFEPASALISGRNRYFTGLDPMQYPETERDEIMQAKEELENYFGKDVLEPHNVEFWKTKGLELTKKTTFLDMRNPEHKLWYYMIKGGAFAEIAPSHENALEGATSKRWYLIDINEYSELGVEDERKINKAIAALENIYENKKFDDIFLVHKVLISSDRGTTLKSPRGAIYKDLSDFIYGKIQKTQKKQTAKMFLDAVELLKADKKKLYLTAYVKDANYFNFLTITEDNQIKNIQTGTKYGSSTEKAVMFLANPVNQAELDNIKATVEEKWNQ